MKQKVDPCVGPESPGPRVHHLGGAVGRPGDQLDPLSPLPLRGGSVTGDFEILSFLNPVESVFSCWRLSKSGNRTEKCSQRRECKQCDRKESESFHRVIW